MFKEGTNLIFQYFSFYEQLKSVSLLFGRMLDSGSKGLEFVTHWSHCIVSLSMTLYPLLSTG